MKLSEIIEEEDQGQPVIELTRKVIQSIINSHAELAASLMFTPVRAHIRLQRRHLVRSREDAAFGHPGSDGPKDGGGDYGTDALSALRKLARETFWDPGSGLYVSYEDATAAQHAAYADYVRRNARPMLDTAERHELAVEIITEAGIDRLRDLPDWQK